MATIIFLIALMILTFMQLMIQGIFLIHRLQQLGYSNLKLIKWLEGNQYRSMLLWNIFELLLPLLMIYLLYVNIKEIPIYKYITSAIMSLTYCWKLSHPFIAKWIGPQAVVKVALVITNRVKRLIITLTCIIILSLVFVFLFSAAPLDKFSLSTWGFFKFNAFLLFISIISPLLVLTANAVNLPVEKFVHWTYFKKAKVKLAKSAIKKIAITGSYGKTSTKFFLSTILAEKYRILFTPASYNTPMGISKVINQNDLLNYDLFIVEMGADHRGDINILCQLVKPDWGIITAIDHQHLESFGSLKNIIETKLSLFRNLPTNSFGIYNYDSKILQQHINNTSFEIPLYAYSMEKNDSAEIEIIATDIKHTRSGLFFKAIFKNGESVNASAEVLGRHNVANLLGCILMAKHMGLTISEIENGIRKIKPVEHRLQKIDSGTGVLVLDDAFNANLSGACEALRVLHEIEGAKKIIVTPGLIELGDQEEKANYIFGQEIAKYTDIAILVGPEKTRSIYAGINENLSKNKIEVIIVNSLNEAKLVLSKKVSLQDVILFENDLPDTFNER